MWCAFKHDTTVWSVRRWNWEVADSSFTTKGRRVQKKRKKSQSSKNATKTHGFEWLPLVLAAFKITIQASKRLPLWVFYFVKTQNRKWVSYTRRLDANGAAFHWGRNALEMSHKCVWKWSSVAHTRGVRTCVYRDRFDVFAFKPPPGPEGNFELSSWRGLCDDSPLSLPQSLYDCHVTHLRLK